MLNHDEIMILRNAANILRRHIGTDTCITCDVSHSLCNDTWIPIEGCAMDSFVIYIEDYIRIHSKCDHIFRCDRSCEICDERSIHNDKDSSI